MQRREFLRTAAGAAGGSAAAASTAGAASAAEDGGGGSGGGEPDFQGHLDGVSNFDGVVDRRGQAEVTVEVGVEANTGAFGFGPAAVHVDNGTTVRFEWTGNGGSHNVVNPAGEFGSELFSQAGVHFERSFDTDGIYNYVCEPHTNLGMKGAIVVGSDYRKKAGASAVTPLDPKHMGVPFQAHFVGFATLLAVFASLVFTFYLLKYGESAHTKGGNN